MTSIQLSFEQRTLFLLLRVVASSYCSIVHSSSVLVWRVRATGNVAIVRLLVSGSGRIHEIPLTVAAIRSISISD